MNVRDELIQSGIPENVHHKLNYCTVLGETAYERTGHKHHGWTVEYKDIDGKSYEKPFYRLKPSSKVGDAKYLTAKGAGCKPYFSPLVEPAFWKGKKDIYITEGEKKADSMTHHGFPCIGLSGVDCWRDKRSGQSAVLPELCEVNFRQRNIYITFDSDVAHNLRVRDALEGFSCWLTGQGGRVRIVQLPCELNGEKNGADDFISRHGPDAFQKQVDLAKDAVKKSAKGAYEFIWTPDTSKSHQIAVMAGSVMHSNIAVRPNVGAYEWQGTHWQRAIERPEVLISDHLHQWLDQMRLLEDRSLGKIKSITSEITTKIKRKDWDNPELLSFSNGTLNTKTREFIKGHSRDDHLTFSFPFEYNPSATCEKWIKFLTETFQGDQQLIQLLRAAMKWSLSPKPDAPFRHELYFDVYGRRGCGKGTISEVLLSLVGKAGYGLARSKTFSNPNALAGLIGKKIAMDQDAAGHLSDCGILNSVVSNELVQTKTLYQDVSCARLGCVIWRFYNDAPSASGAGLEGMGRRCVTFRIENQPAKPDEKLKSKLLAEIDGIFWWVWSMSESDMDSTLKNRGQIEAVMKASLETQLDAHPHLRFFIDEFPNGHTDITASNLYSRYRQWCYDNGHQPTSNARFGKDIKKVHGLVHSSRKSAGKLYIITNPTSIDWAAHFSIGSSRTKHVGSDPASVHSSEPNHTSPDPLQHSQSQQSMYGMHSSEPTIAQEEIEEDIYVNKKVCDQTLHTLHTLHSEPWPPATVTGRVQAAQQHGCRTEDEILKFAHNHQWELSRIEVKRTLERLRQKAVV